MSQRAPHRSSIRSVVWLCALLGACVSNDKPTEKPKATMHVHYLEVVTPDVDSTCATLAAEQRVEFSDPVAELGGARTATLQGGGLLGVRAPMRPDEEPTVRPYMLVDDIDRAVATAQSQGAVIAMPPTEIPGRGKFAIYFQGGNQYGLWQ